MTAYLTNYAISTVLHNAFPITYDIAYYGYKATVLTYTAASYVIPAEVLFTTSAVIAIPTTAFYGYKTYKAVEKINRSISTLANYAKTTPLPHKDQSHL